MKDHSTRDQIVQLFRESIIIQSLITLIAVSTVCIMFLAPIFQPEHNIEIPASLHILVGTVLGYWFKTKDRYNSEQQAARMYSYEQQAARFVVELSKALDKEVVNKP